MQTAEIAANPGVGWPISRVISRKTSQLPATTLAVQSLLIRLAAPMAGYSGTPLPRKLGLKPNARFGVWSAPAQFSEQLGPLPPGVTLVDAARGASALNLIVCFVSSRAELTRVLARAQKRLEPDGRLWLCGPKKASGIKTDVGESEVRTLGLASGLVDNKVCAIDEVWSGLRLVVRVRDRPK